MPTRAHPWTNVININLDKNGKHGASANATSVLSPIYTRQERVERERERRRDECNECQPVGCGILGKSQQFKQVT